MCTEGIWLRDHCRCPTCYHTDTRQRLLETYDLPLDIAPEHAQIRDDALDVQWPDGHSSTYLLSSLRNAMAKRPRKETDRQTFWDASIAATPPVTQYNEFMDSTSGIKSWLTDIKRTGFALVDGVPATEQATQAVIKRVYAPMHTFYGEWWTFSNNALDHADTAYTNLSLPSHTDMTYCSDPAGLQVFHCLSFDGTGGESTLVDGFKAGRQLRDQYPEIYRTLTTVNIPQTYADPVQKIWSTISRPVLIVDSTSYELVRVNFNTCDRAVLDASTVDMSRIQEIYRALRTFESILREEQNVYTFPLTPGRVLIFDNWRVLHGREGFTGSRTLSGCYVSRDEHMLKQRMYLDECEEAN
ncbi:trimethyllysine dioxygenase [Sphaeroforma arctica JP610]|uniref:trimethyllysine dioxygenase n=1 Tax=Sphaeroforma arctica JP610 TaxID=667725 RepID=A0A0L0G5Y9_9EUKA|nr:trimethyllysine dioxygenase [Sphaeroforma arctica JP610]KNC84442.1 trimethyllysine dioxygenase [Sphaeroforma arctica JP610]|eukprot:XP_014158344.1 trimethyllysine dioxygenase [Sphaeroforma arctica JP610]